MSNNATSKSVLTRTEAAVAAGVSERTVSRWMARGVLPFTRDHLTGRVTIRTDHLYRVLRENAPKEHPTP